MRLSARLLALYLALVWLDSMVGWGVFHGIVHGATGVWCHVTERSQWERHQCTNKVFNSRELWVGVSLLLGMVAAYVAYSALSTGRW